jgi:hypothetical protein
MSMVREALIRAGVSADRIETGGFGAEPNGPSALMPANNAASATAESR